MGWDPRAARGWGAGRAAIPARNRARSARTFPRENVATRPQSPMDTTFPRDRRYPLPLPLPAQQLVQQRRSVIICERARPTAVVVVLLVFRLWCCGRFVFSV